MTLRPDLAAIIGFVAPGARVIDVGCGDGELLEALRDTRAVDGRGIELSRAGVLQAVARGLSVVQGDADTDLVDYPNAAFDVAILSQALQAMHAPRAVLEQLLRIAARAVVSFPNFGHWRVRVALLAKGRMPVTRTLPIAWHETQNIHLCTIHDFEALVADVGADIDTARFFAGGKVIGPAFANVRAEQAVYLLRRRN